ncbi:chondroadherin-like [Cephus cinctus]|uniref:Chondroadherin-like n=1 Tax=Cephus cinctus TaxID=211228 RepID=A0AAJ7BPY1_CEPCN|nr:chondroadherin-like [Cephus cinctus]
MIQWSLAVIAFIGILASANGYCVKHTVNHNDTQYRHYICFRSTDYRESLARISADQPTGVMFKFYPVPKIINGSFESHKGILIDLGFQRCEVTEIDDHAFKGLINLKMLMLDKNNLQTLKAVWFESLTNLNTLSVTENQLQVLDPEVFVNVPNLVMLNIGDNKLQCLDMPKFRALTHLKYVGLDFNKWTWKCRAQLTEFLNNLTDAKKLTRYITCKKCYNVYKECAADQSFDDVNETTFNACADEKMDKLVIQENTKDCDD